MSGKPPGNSGRGEVRVKVAALFPEHELERFTELFWNRIQDWRRQGCP